MRLILLGGLSGSGKSVALRMLEDLGYYSIDNVPTRLVEPVIAGTIDSGELRFSQLAIGVDPRSPEEEIAHLPDLISRLRQREYGCTVVYLMTDDDVLLRRYSETRRRHPLAQSGRGLREAISRERTLLIPLAQIADTIIDTTKTNVHQLRELVHERVAPETPQHMTLVFESFAYRSGVPRDVDMVFDMRCLPNPHWEPELRNKTGQDPEVTDYLEQHVSVTRMRAELIRWLEQWVPAYSASNRSYLTIAFGCTGGQHRSVYMAEKLARHFVGQPMEILIRHTELGDGHIRRIKQAPGQPQSRNNPQEGELA